MRCVQARGRWLFWIGLVILDRFGYFGRCMGCVQARGSEMKRKRRLGRLPGSLLSVGMGLVVTDSSTLLGVLAARFS